MAKYFLISCLMVIAQFGMAQQPSDTVIYQNSIEDSLAWGNVTPEQVEGFMAMAKMGHSTSQYYLGRCYFNGYGGLPNDKYKALEYFGQAAEKDQTEALYYLGFCYRFGFGVTKNEDRAQQLFEKAVKWLEEEIDNNRWLWSGTRHPQKFFLV